MKLVLSNFGQDISLQGEPTTSYLVFTDAESGKVFRIPVPQETVTRLALIIDGAYQGEPSAETGSGTQEPAEEELLPEGAQVFGGDVQRDPEHEPLGDPAVEQEEEEPTPAPVVIRKRMAPAPGPSLTRAALQKVRQRLETSTPADDDGVPNM